MKPNATRRPTRFHIATGDGRFMRPTSHSNGRFLEPCADPHVFIGEAHTRRIVNRTADFLRQLETSLIQDAPQIRQMAAELRATLPHTIKPAATA